MLSCFSLLWTAVALGADPVPEEAADPVPEEAAEEAVEAAEEAPPSLEEQLRVLAGDQRPLGERRLVQTKTAVLDPVIGAQRNLESHDDQEHRGCEYDGLQPPTTAHTSHGRQTTGKHGANPKDSFGNIPT